MRVFKFEVVEADDIAVLNAHLLEAGKEAALAQHLVEGPWLERLMANVNFSDYESRMYFDKMLRQSGLFDQLERMGIQDGDIVSMYNLEFEYQR